MNSFKFQILSIPSKLLILPIEIKICLIIWLGFISVSGNTTDATFEGAIASKSVRMICIGLALFWSCTFIAIRKIDINLSKPCVLALVLFLSSQVLSTIFSDFKILSAIKTLEIFQAMLLCIIGMVSFKCPRYSFYKFNIFMLFCLSLVIGIEAIIFPDEAWRFVDSNTLTYKFMLRGVYPSLNSNTVGLVGGMVASAFFPFIFLVKNYKKYIVYSVVGLAITLLSYSRSSLISLMSTMLFLLFLLKRKGLICFGICLCVITVYLYPNIFTKFQTAFKRGQDTETMVGVVASRPIIWKIIWEENKLSLIGHGPSAAFNVAPLRYTGWGHAHSSFFQMLADCGWIGVVSFYSLIVVTLLRLLKLYKFAFRIKNDDDTIYLFSVISSISFLCMKTFGHSTLTVFGYDFLILISIIVFIERNLAKFGSK